MESRTKPSVMPALGSHFEMRHRHGVCHKTFDAAERLSQGEYCEVLKEAPNGTRATGELKTQHGPEPHLL